MKALITVELINISDNRYDKQIKCKCNIEGVYNDYEADMLSIATGFLLRTYENAVNEFKEKNKNKIEIVGSYKQSYNKTDFLEK